jgi:hypothetical protein
MATDTQCIFTDIINYRGWGLILRSVAAALLALSTVLPWDYILYEWDILGMPAMLCAWGGDWHYFLSTLGRQHEMGVGLLAQGVYVGAYAVQTSTFVLTILAIIGAVIAAIFVILAFMMLIAHCCGCGCQDEDATGNK